MKSSILVLASLCTAFAHEEGVAHPMRKRNQMRMMQHKSSGTNARLLTTEEYDPYLGIHLRQLPGEEAAMEANAEAPMSMSETEPTDPAAGEQPGAGADAAPEADGGAQPADDADAGGPSAGVAAEAMSMSMPTEEDKGFLDKVTDTVTDAVDKIKDATGQSG